MMIGIDVLEKKRLVKCFDAFPSWPFDNIATRAPRGTPFSTPIKPRRDKKKLACEIKVNQNIKIISFNMMVGSSFD